MNTNAKFVLLSGLCAALASGAAAATAPAKAKAHAPAPAKAAPAKAKAKPPATDACLGSIVVDAATGKVVCEDRADTRCHPASTLKLMDMLIIQERLRAGTLKLDEKVHVTAESAKIGGSQVYLAENEEFTVDEMLYALMVQSANDAAMALAIHLAGSKEAFIELMNQHAKQLGMNSTVFHSVHGLPPAKDQEGDVTTPRDFALLCRELVTKYPETLQYTSTRARTFRPAKPFQMTTHNHLLGAVDGCDGLKTGYYREAGYSIAATAQRNGVRVIAVVMGSPDKTTRDAKAKELLTKGFAEFAPPAAAAAPAAPVPLPVAPAPAAKK